MDITVLTLKSLEDQETEDYHTSVIVCVRGRSFKSFSEEWVSFFSP